MSEKHVEAILLILSAIEIDHSQAQRIQTATFHTARNAPYRESLGSFYRDEPATS